MAHESECSIKRSQTTCESEFFKAIYFHERRSVYIHSDSLYPGWMRLRHEMNYDEIDFHSIFFERFNKLHPAGILHRNPSINLDAEPPRFNWKITSEMINPSTKMKSDLFRSKKMASSDANR